MHNKHPAKKSIRSEECVKDEHRLIDANIILCHFCTDDCFAIHNGVNTYSTTVYFPFALYRINVFLNLVTNLVSEFIDRLIIAFYFNTLLFYDYSKLDIFIAISFTANKYMKSCIDIQTVSLVVEFQNVSPENRERSQDFV